jgi:hypothetical protein
MVALPPRLPVVPPLPQDLREDSAAVAHLKVYVGQKRSKMTIPGSPVQLNGSAILNEGLTELKELREFMVTHNNPIKIK